MARAATVVVRLAEVEVRHRDRIALTGVSLSVRTGERVAVIGPSGAGKSTLIGLLNATVAATSGTVGVLGTELGSASSSVLRATQRRIGTIHQGFDLVGELAVIHNVNAGRLGAWSLWRALTSLLVGPREVDGATEALARVGLSDRLQQRTSTLSGGERQRVAIARVLRQRPALLLADEPVASLDPTRGAEIIELLHEVTRHSGATLLASLHDVELARRGFDRILGLRDGQLVFDVHPEQLSPALTEALYETSAPEVIPPVPPPRGGRGC